MKNKKLHKKNEFYLAQWLDGKLSDEELASYVSEADVAAYKKLKQGLRLYETLESPMDASYSKVKTRIEKKKKVRQLYKQVAMSAAAAIAIFFAIFSAISTDITLNSTDYAEQKTILLLDGSEVVLNAKSELSYNETTWNDIREVYLKGEAFFKVKPGERFTVKTDNGSVLVVGTQFNVNSNDDYFEVSCFEGKVEVRLNSDETVLLLPLQTIRKIDGNSYENWSSEIDTPTWTLGESTFRSVPLRYVIAAIERQYGVNFDSSKIDDSLIFTGSFGHSDLNVALTTVFKAMQIRYKEKEGKVIELSVPK